MDFINNFSNFVEKKTTNVLTKFKLSISDIAMARSSEKEALEYLCNLQDFNSIFQDKRANHNLSVLIFCSKQSEEFNNLSLEMQNKFITFFMNSFKDFYPNLVEILRLFKQGEIKSEAFEKFYALICIITNYSEISNTLRIIMHENNGLDIFFEYLKIILDKLISLKYNETQLYELSVLITDNIYNLSHLKHLFTEQWNTSKYLDTLFNLDLRLKDEDKLWNLRLTLIAAIVCVYEEKNFEKLTDTDMVIKNVSNLIGECAKTIKNKECLRLKTMLYDQNNRIIRVIVLDNGWNLIDLIDCLYNMSHNDLIKYDIYFTNKLKNYLRIIIYMGNEFEREYALKMLYHLCFERRIVDDVMNDQELQNYIKMINNSDIKNNTLKNCNGITWLIEEHYNRTNRTTDSSSKTESVNKHIMISYNSKSKELCLKIKSELEKNGFLVWIDVENISGSSLESMASAIENSFCVLMCMTDYYKKSSNCRLEAEYAVRLNKPIIPLIMEKGYKPDGWLGIILGSKIFVDFTKYDFQECSIRLLKEIAEVPNKENNPSSKTKTENSSDQKNKILAWNEKDVEKWMHEKQFEKNIIKSIIPSNGEMLESMYLLLIKSPDYFGGSVDCNKKMKLRDVVYFSNELKKLFTPQSNPNNLDISEDKRKILLWKEIDVEKWMQDKQFDKNIIKSIAPCNGEMLESMHSLLLKNHDYFCGSVDPSKKAKLRDVIYFSNELKKLFN